MIIFTKNPGQRPLKGILAFFLVLSINANAGVKAVPGMPGPIIGQTNVCAFVGTGQAVSYTISPVAGAELYLWTIPPTASIISGQGTTSILVTFSAGFTASSNKQLRVRAISQDGNSGDRILYLASQQPVTPGSITGPSNACIYIGTSNQATYTTARDAAASGYIWGTDAGTTLVTHPNGAGANDTIIRVLFKNGYKTGPVTVQAINHCGFSATRILIVSGSAPSIPGTISGPTNACAYMLPNGIVATYSINPVTGASSYLWTTPPGCIVTHPNGAGANDIMITVQYPSDFTGGSVSVIASSGCDDSSPRSLVITKLNPSAPGGITPIEQVSCPDRQILYKLPSMPSNATAVNWTVPVDALSFTGQGSGTITVFYPAIHVSGMVTATSINNCASSSTRQSVVNLTRCQVERMSEKGSGTKNQANRGSNEQSNTNDATGQDNQQPVVANEALRLSIAPNPSKGDFKLQVFTINKDIINIRLLDLQGRELKKMNIAQGQSVIFGNELKPGTYIVEVSQGKIKHTQKLLKI